MKIIRVFPRRTKATPTDELAFIGDPPFYAEADKVMVSVSFTWDIPEAERLAKAWAQVAPVEVGGCAYGMPGGEFVPGMFLKEGYIITSRGCPNRCWFCSVWKREAGQVRELEIKDGWNLQDDNLLACSEKHIREVFDMLKQQKHRAVFSGGLEAKLLQSWHVDLLTDLKPQQMFFAYDTPDDYEPLVIAGKILREAGFNRNKMYCYNLIGYPKDTFEDAERRLRQTKDLGFTPFAMLWKNDKGESKQDWRKFQRLWCRPANIFRR